MISRRTYVFVKYREESSSFQGQIYWLQKSLPDIKFLIFFGFNNLRFKVVSLTLCLSKLWRSWKHLSFPRSFWCALYSLLTMMKFGICSRNQMSISAPVTEEGKKKISDFCRKQLNTGWEKSDLWFLFQRFSTFSIRPNDLLIVTTL